MRGIAVLGGLLTLLATPVARADDPTFALYQQSYNLEGKSDLPGALAALERVGTLGGDGYIFHLRHGWLLYLNARYLDAVAAYGRAVELEPHAVEPRLGAMLPLMALRRWDEAEKQCLEVLKVAPGEFLAVSRLAYIHYQQGRYAKAEGFYRQALTLYPSNVEMRAGLGWSLLEQGRKPAAKQEFEAILAVAPEYASARQGLALVKE